MPKRIVKREQGSQNYSMSRRAYDRLRSDFPIVKEEYERASRAIGETSEGSDWHDNFAFEQAHRDFEVARERCFGVLQKLESPAIIEPRRDISQIGIGNTILLITVYS